MDNRYIAAKELIDRCCNPMGISASAERYKGQKWTRDAFLAISPTLHCDNPAVTGHIDQLIMRQREDGKIPILYVENVNEFISRKEMQAAQKGKVPFMLRRYNEEGEEGLANLTPATRDSEMLFIIAVYQDPRLHSDRVFRAKALPAIDRAISYIKGKCVDGLVPGADWRDVRDDLDTKCVLTNACLLDEAFSRHGIDTSGIIIKLQKEYWNKELGFFDDYPGANSFDILGNALAILNHIPTDEQREQIFKHAETLVTPYGYKLCDTFLPSQTEKEREIMSRDNAVVWPWCSFFMLLALGEYYPEKAKLLFQQWSANTKGFYEWYDIVDGDGYGSPDQLWSAALYMRVYDDLNYDLKKQMM